MAFSKGSIHIELMPTC